MLCLYLDLKNIILGDVPSEDLICHQCAICLQLKLPAIVSRQDAEGKRRAVMRGVLIDDRQLQDSGADGLVFLE